ncbi:hypothetical protein IAU60_001901 [Kwoniella sp. DSM 27419]
MSAQEQISAAEQSINSSAAKQGGGRQSDSANESGVNEGVTAQFPGSTVQVGGTKRGENPTIPPEEGGDDVNKVTGRPTKANDFEGVGGPEDKAQDAIYDRPGDQDVTGNVRN